MAITLYWTPCHHFAATRLDTSPAHPFQLRSEAHQHVSTLLRRPAQVSAQLCQILQQRKGKYSPVCSTVRSLMARRSISPKLPKRLALSAEELRELSLSSSTSPMLTPSRSKRYERLLRNNGISLNGGPIKTRTENKAKKRTADAVAKAAESKRRKIEGDHTDAAADDEDVKPMIPKIEPGTWTMIKQEPASGYFDAGYPPPRLPHPEPPKYGYGLSSAANSAGGHSANTAQDTPWNSSQTPWLSLTGTGMSAKSMTALHAPKHDRATSPTLAYTLPLVDSTAVAAKEVVARRQSLILPALDSLGEEATTEQSQGEDTVFRDFCNSDLFMPPLQQTCTPPASPPTQSQIKDSGGLPNARRPALPPKSSFNVSCQPKSSSDQVESIVIED
jgi:hypothetical protein